MNFNIDNLYSSCATLYSYSIFIEYRSFSAWMGRGDKHKFGCTVFWRIWHPIGVILCHPPVSSFMPVFVRIWQLTYFNMELGDWLFCVIPCI